MLSVCPSLCSTTPVNILGCANVLVEIRKVFTEVERINPRYVGDNTSPVCLLQTSFLANFHETTWSAKDGFARGTTVTLPDVFTQPYLALALGNKKYKVLRIYKVQGKGTLHTQHSLHILSFLSFR